MNLPLVTCFPRETSSSYFCKAELISVLVSSKHKIKFRPSADSNQRPSGRQGSALATTPPRHLIVLLSLKILLIFELEESFFFIIMAKDQPPHIAKHVVKPIFRNPVDTFLE